MSSLPLSYWSPGESYMTPSRTVTYIFTAIRIRVNWEQKMITPHNNNKFDIKIKFDNATHFEKNFYTLPLWMGSQLTLNNHQLQSRFWKLCRLWIRWSHIRILEQPLQYSVTFCSPADLLLIPLTYIVAIGLWKSYAKMGVGESCNCMIFTDLR
jgi:hypothetical protein